jgi:hypothetical protein
MEAGTTEKKVAQGMSPGASTLAGRGKVAPGSRLYLGLAEAGYLGAVALALLNLGVLAVTFDSIYVNSLASTFPAVVLSFVLAIAWIQLGRKQGIPWFIAAGALGGVSAVATLAQQFESGSNTPTLALGQIMFFVSVIYFATQLLAFNSASNSFQVRPFKYAAYFLACGFVVALLGGPMIAVLTAAQQTGAFVLVLSSDFGFSVAMSLAALVGFHRLRGFPS